MAIVTPYIPTFITVHLGTPSQDAINVTVSFLDYIKNVASSEIYPTWEPEAIRANVLAQISFALNRVYTEFYPSQGYDFNITSSTAYDQKFIRDRNIFENVSEIVDEIFDSYIRRIGFLEPLSAKFCNGTTSTCDGLSQWGSQNLAQQGYEAMDILHNYYGDNIEMVVDAPLQEPRESYPGTPLQRGDVGEYVLIVQVMLNRIAQNYPAIPKIWPTTGVFDRATEASVRKFQEVFHLTVDGIVGKATWYQQVYLYVGILRLSELVSEGQTFDEVKFQYPGVVYQGQSGEAVRALQYMLAVAGEFYDVIPPLEVDGVFGPATAAAVRAFQRSAGLTVDGIAGEETWKALHQVYASLESGYFNSEVNFPVELQASLVASVDQAMGDNPTHAVTTREMQYPGRPLTLGSSDHQRGTLV